MGCILRYLIIWVFLFSCTLYSFDEISDDIFLDEVNDPSIMDLPDATVIEVENDLQPILKPKSLKTTDYANDNIKEVNDTNSILKPKDVQSPKEVKVKKLDSLSPKVPLLQNKQNISVVPKTQYKPKSIKKPKITKKIKSKQKSNFKPIVIVKHIPDKQKIKTYDFWELLDIALKNSTRLILKLHDLQITQKDLDLINSEYYPNLSVRYSSEYYNGYARATIGGSFYPEYSQYRNSLSLNLDYELYKFGATGLKKRITQKEIEIIKSELAIAKEQVSLELLEYYTQALKAQTQIFYKDQIKRIQDKIIQKKWRLFEAGQLSKVELSKDQKSLLTLEKELLTHKLRFLEAIKNIQILTNISISDGNRLAMLEPKRVKVKSFEQSALAKNLILQIEKKKEELELIKKDYLPTVYANSGFRFYGSDEDSFLTAVKNTTKNSWDFGVGFKWDIFNGYKTETKVQKLQLELNKLLEQYRLAKFEFETRDRKRELLKQSLDKVLQVETNLLSQVDKEEDIFLRLKRAGQTPSIQIDYIDINKLQSELDFKLSVIEHSKATVSGELIN